jgi:sugar lactone lactonase YvrE
MKNTSKMTKALLWGALIFVLTFTLVGPAAAQGIITTVAGTGDLGFNGDNQPATNASLHYPFGVAVDAAGNLFIADWFNHRIRKVDASTGIITTVAGTGVASFNGDNQPATNASLSSPPGVAVDAAGNLFIADRNNRRIRKVDASTGTITTVAGNGWCCFSGDTGLAIDARLADPVAVAFDAAGNLFIADYYVNLRIRKVDTSGIITTVVGTGAVGFNGDNQPATTASLSGPVAVAFDAAGNLFIADYQDQRIRKVVPGSDGVINGDTEEIITTVAGTGVQGFNGDGIPATSAQLSNPNGVAFDAAGNLYFADTGNQRIRRVSAPNQPPVADAGEDQTVECTGFDGASVTLDGSASSDPDGDALSFEWTDADANVVGTTASVNLTLPLGSHTFTLTVDDGKGGTASDSVTVVVQDTTPPVLTLTKNSVSVILPLDATTATIDVLAESGATASDLCDPDPEITPSSPGTFAPGMHSVTITATDASGNTAHKQFAVEVLTASQAIQGLSDLVVNFNLKQGIANSLDAKLQNAFDALEAANAGLRQDAQNKLQAFINGVEAQRGKELTDEQADQLIALTQSILSVL